MSIPNVHWKLIDGFEPRAWKFARKTVFTIQNISNTLPFCSWKPSSYKCINLNQIWLNHNWTARDKNDYTFYRATDGGYDSQSRIRKCQVKAVPKCLCVRWFAHYNNGIVEFVGFNVSGVGILHKHHFCFRVYCVPDRIQDCGT